MVEYNFDDNIFLFPTQILTPDFRSHQGGNKDMRTLVQVLNMKGIVGEI